MSPVQDESSKIRREIDRKIAEQKAIRDDLSKRQVGADRLISSRQAIDEPLSEEEIAELWHPIYLIKEELKRLGYEIENLEVDKSVADFTDSIKKLGDELSESLGKIGVKSERFLSERYGGEGLIEEQLNQLSTNRLKAESRRTEEYLMGAKGALRDLEEESAAEYKLADARKKIQEAELDHLQKVSEYWKQLLEVDPTAKKTALDMQYNSLREFRDQNRYIPDLNQRMQDNRMAALRANAADSTKDVGAFTAGKEAFANQFEGELDAVNLAIDTALAGADAMKNAFADSWSAWVSGAESAKEAMRSFALTVLDALQKIIAKELASAFIRTALGGLNIGGTKSQVSPANSTSGVGTWGANPNAIPDVPTFEFSKGGYIARGNGYEDDQIARLMRGEFVLRKEAVSSLGLDFVKRLNSLGRAGVSDSDAYARGGHVGEAKNVIVPPKPSAPSFSANPSSGGISVEVNIDNSGNAESKTQVQQGEASEVGKQVGKTIEAAVNNQVAKMMRPGGMIYNMSRSRN